MFQKIELEAGLTVLQTCQGQWRDQGKHGRLSSAGERRSAQAPLKISGPRGVVAGTGDSLGKDNLEMPGEATRGPAGQAGSDGLKQSLWRATPSPVLSLCPLTAPGVIAGLPQPGLPERSTKQAAGPSAKNIMW